MTHIQHQNIKNIYFDITNTSSSTDIKTRKWILYDIKSYILLHDENEEYEKTTLIYKRNNKYYKIPIFISKYFKNLSENCLLSFNNKLSGINYICDIMIKNIKYKIEIKSLFNIIDTYSKKKEIFLHPKETSPKSIEDMIRSSIFNNISFSFFPYIAPYERIQKKISIPIKYSHKLIIDSHIMNIYDDILLKEKKNNNIIILFSNFIIYVPKLKPHDIIYMIPLILKYYSNDLKYYENIIAESNNKEEYTNDKNIYMLEFLSNLRYPSLTRFIFLASLFSLFIINEEANIFNIYNELNYHYDNIIINQDNKFYNDIKKYNITKEEVLESFVWGRLYLNIFYGYNTLKDENERKDLLYFKKLIFSSYDYDEIFKRGYFLHFNKFRPYINSTNINEYLNNQNDEIYKYVYREILNYIDESIQKIK